jgi:hypothetical protein
MDRSFNRRMTVYVPERRKAPRLPRVERLMPDRGAKTARYYHRERARQFRHLIALCIAARVSIILVIWWRA